MLVRPSTCSPGSVGPHPSARHGSNESTFLFLIPDRRGRPAKYQSFVPSHMLPPPSMKYQTGPVASRPRHNSRQRHGPRVCLNNPEPGERYKRAPPSLVRRPRSSYTERERDLVEVLSAIIIPGDILRGTDAGHIAALTVSKPPTSCVCEDRQASCEQWRTQKCGYQALALGRKFKPACASLSSKPGVLVESVETGALSEGVLAARSSFVLANPFAFPVTDGSSRDINSAFGYHTRKFLGVLRSISCHLAS